MTHRSRRKENGRVVMVGLKLLTNDHKNLEVLVHTYVIPNSTRFVSVYVLKAMIKLAER